VVNLDHGIETRQNKTAVDKFLDGVKDEQMRIDCFAVQKLME
jgi:hypothetical protein